MDRDKQVGVEPARDFRPLCQHQLAIIAASKRHTDTAIFQQSSAQGHSKAEHYILLNHTHTACARIAAAMPRIDYD